MTGIQKTHHTPDKTLAAVCGLFCAGCSLYIATTEDPKRLKRLAAHFQVTEEEIKCFGCRADKRGPYCQTCKMSACAAEKGIDFCGDCEAYPCADLTEFQAARPHRIELWDDLDRIKQVGYERWFQEKIAEYGCDRCQTINSAYDSICRACGHEPGNAYVKRHKREIARKSY
ncbi:DUF3795 domain-containing protein [Thermodesulfobacteriota bacterium]